MLTQAAELFPFGWVTSPYPFFQSNVPRGIANSWTSSSKEEKEVEEKSSLLIQHCQSLPRCEMGQPCPLLAAQPRHLMYLMLRKRPLRIWGRKTFSQQGTAFLFLIQTWATVGTRALFLPCCRVNFSFLPETTDQIRNGENPPHSSSTAIKPSGGRCSGQVKVSVSCTSTALTQSCSYTTSNLLVNTGFKTPRPWRIWPYLRCSKHHKKHGS